MTLSKRLNTKILNFEYQNMFKHVRISLQKQQVKVTLTPKALSLIIAQKFIIDKPLLSRQPTR